MAGNRGQARFCLPRRAVGLEWDKRSRRGHFPFAALAYAKKNLHRGPGYGKVLSAMASPAFMRGSSAFKPSGSGRTNLIRLQPRRPAYSATDVDFQILLVHELDHDFGRLQRIPLLLGNGIVEDRQPFRPIGREKA